MTERLWQEMSDLRDKIVDESEFKKIAETNSRMRELWSDYVALIGGETSLGGRLPSKEKYLEGVSANNQVLTAYNLWSPALYACDLCGGDVRRLNNTAYMSIPPKYKYRCDQCNNEEVHE